MAQELKVWSLKRIWSEQNFVDWNKKKRVTKEIYMIKNQLNLIFENG
jgi:hypothetical protein